MNDKELMNGLVNEGMNDWRNELEWRDEWQWTG